MIPVETAAGKASTPSTRKAILAAAAPTIPAITPAAHPTNVINAATASHTSTIATGMEIGAEHMPTIAHLNADHPFFAVGISS